jgi:hypothetical protein
MRSPLSCAAALSHVTECVIPADPVTVESIVIDRGRVLAVGHRVTTTRKAVRQS